MAKDCRLKKEARESNAEEEQNTEAVFAEEQDHAFNDSIPSRTLSEEYWILDSGASIHLIGNMEKLHNLSDYKGRRVARTVNGSKLPITHVGSMVVAFKSSNYKVPLQKVYLVPDIKKNIISVAQLTSFGHFVLFGPKDVKIYRKLEISEEPMIKGRRLRSAYVFSEKTKKILTVPEGGRLEADGYMAKDCRLKRKAIENNAGEEWDAAHETLFPTEKEDYAFTATMPRKFNYEKDWSVDSGCSLHSTGNVKKLQNLSDYKGRYVATTADEKRLKIAHVGSTVLSLKSSKYKLPLQKVYHIPDVKKNLISVAQLTSSGHFVLFGPKDVKVYCELEISEEPIIKGQRIGLNYVLSLETAYADDEAIKN